jgi:hypothetical protein
LFSNKAAPKRYLRELLNSDHSLKQLKKTRKSLAGSFPLPNPLKDGLVDGDINHTEVKLASWRETEASLAQVKVPICRAASTPNLHNNKVKKEFITNKKLWDYIVRLEKTILEQQQKLRSMTHEQQMEIDMLYNFNSRPKDEASDIEQLAQEVIVKDTKIQELVRIISRESTEENYFSRREDELNAQSIKLEKEKEEIENSKKDIKALKTTLKHQNKQLKYKEELLTSHIEQLKTKTKQLIQEEFRLKQYKSNIEDDIKLLQKDISFLIENFKLPKVSIEYSSEWVQEAHNKLSIVFNQLSKEIEEKDKISSELELSRAEYNKLYDDYKKSQLKYERAELEIEQLEKKQLALELELASHKEELSALKNRGLIHNLQVDLNQSQYFKHSKSLTKLRDSSTSEGSRFKSMEIQERESMSEPELSNKVFERRKPKYKKAMKSNKVLIGSLKSNIESVLEKYRGEEIAKFTDELIKRLDAIISNAKIEEAKMSEITEGINESIVKRNQHNMNEQKKYTEKIRCLTNDKYEVKNIKRQLLKRLNYISALEQHLKVKEEELLNREQVLIIKEVKAQDYIKSGLYQLTTHLSSIKEQKEELMKLEATRVKLNTILTELTFTSDKEELLNEIKSLLENTNKNTPDLIIRKEVEDVEVAKSVMVIINKVLKSINKDEYDILKNNIKKAIREISSLLRLHSETKELTIKGNNKVLENVQEQIKKNRSILTESERIGKQIKHLRCSLNNFT